MWTGVNALRILVRTALIALPALQRLQHGSTPWVQGKSATGSLSRIASIRQLSPRLSTSNSNASSPRPHGSQPNACENGEPLSLQNSKPSSRPRSAWHQVFLGVQPSQP